MKKIKIETTKSKYTKTSKLDRAYSILMEKSANNFFDKGNSVLQEYKQSTATYLVRTYTVYGAYEEPIR